MLEDTVFLRTLSLRSTELHYGLWSARPRLSTCLESPILTSFTSTCILRRLVHVSAVVWAVRSAWRKCSKIVGKRRMFRMTFCKRRMHDFYHEVWKTNGSPVSSIPPLVGLIYSSCRPAVPSRSLSEHGEIYCLPSYDEFKLLSVPLPCSLWKSPATPSRQAKPRS